MRDRMLEAIACKAERDQRVVVRPDRAVVIGHRIVARLAARHGADTPAREKMRPHQVGGDEAGAVFAHHAAEQELPGVRRAHPARLFGAVERERIGAEIVTPERFLKTFGELPRLDLQLFSHLALAEPRRATRRQPPGGIHIALHFGERDMTLGQTAVGVKDRVVRILPALIGQALLGRGPVLDESVPVGIAWPVDPAQSCLDRRPQFGERLFVAGPFYIKAAQQHKQRRRINAAVILRERHLAQRRHLAAAHFMQDLSGFGVGERIECLGLIECQSLQHAARDPRIDPQHLHRGNDSVATECRRIPGNARIGISSLRRVRHQHIEVGHRLAQHLIEDVI